MARVFRIFLLIALFVSIAPSAQAGGWWSGIDLDKSYLATGQQHSFVTKQFTFNTLEEARRAEKEQPYRPYLVAGMTTKMVWEAVEDGNTRNWWTLGASSIIEVGTLTVDVREANLANVSADLDLNGVPPGSYQLMFCDTGCSHPLGNLTPTPVTVLEDPLLARVANSIADLRTKTGEVQHELAGHIRRAARASVDQSDMKAMQEELRLVKRSSERTRDQLTAAGKRISALEKDASGGSGPLLWMLVGCLVGALVVYGFRRRPTRELPPLDRMDVEAELRKLERLEEKPKDRVSSGS